MDNNRGTDTDTAAAGRSGMSGMSGTELCRPADL